MADSCWYSGVMERHVLFLAKDSQPKYKLPNGKLENYLNYNGGLPNNLSFHALQRAFVA